MPVFLLRWVLREVLREGVDVRTGRRGVEVGEVVDAEGEKKVRLRFDDESVEEGDFLVGMFRWYSFFDARTRRAHIRRVSLSFRFVLQEPKVCPPPL